MRALYESNRRDDIQIVAINDLGDASINAHLTQYDTAHGRFNANVTVDGTHMIVNGDSIQILSERNPESLPWDTMNIDVVYECTGLFTKREKAAMHITAGAKK